MLRFMQHRRLFLNGKNISGRTHKKLLEERFPLENDLLTYDLLCSQEGKWDSGSVSRFFFGCVLEVGGCF